MISTSSGNCDKIIQGATTHDVALIHEMIHWFHELRYPHRKIIEDNSDPNNELFLGNYFLGAYYWSFCYKESPNLINVKNDLRVLGSQLNWNHVNNPTVSFEEMRTILGVPTDIHYVNGDDIAENLYRACISTPLRYGHANNVGYEDSRVIDKIIEVCTNNLRHYGLHPQNIRLNNEDPVAPTRGGLGMSGF
jgi:hypothetical protein